MSRFARQIILPGFGKAGQDKLSRARVLVVGAGGLGCPILLHLAAAGVGQLGIADGDNVSESNLNRQTLFGIQDVGKPKAKTAASILEEKYPDISFEVFPEYLTNENLLEIIENYDLVLDGTDNFGTRYMINDACFLMKKPLIMGAIFQYEGQVATFNFGNNPINYRDIYPFPPQEHEVPNCGETGVLGVLPGIIGTLQAAEAIKLLSGMGEVAENKVLFYNLKTSAFFEVEVAANEKARTDIPRHKEEFKKKNYNIHCGAAESISWGKAEEWIKGFANSRLIDVRELGEEPLINDSRVSKIPKADLEANPERVRDIENIILFCRSGKRSMFAARILKKIYPEKKIFSIEGGILHPTSPFHKNHETKA